MVQNQHIMKLFLTAIIISLSSLSMANTVDATANTDTKMEVYIGGDKGKKNRRHKRVNKKRKRHCNRAARRNFAG